MVVNHPPAIDDSRDAKPTPYYRLHTDDSLYKMHDICRGSTLEQAIETVSKGLHANVLGVVGGFSTDTRVCKRFTQSSSDDTLFTMAARGEGDKVKIPTLIEVSSSSLEKRYPTVTKVEYDEEWLEEHPDIAEHIATPQYGKVAYKSFGYEGGQKQIRESAMVYQSEKEVVVTDTDIVYLTPRGYEAGDQSFRVGMNIYLNPALACAIVNSSDSECSNKTTLERFNERLESASNRLLQRLADDERLTTDMLKGMDIGIYACNDMLTNLTDDGKGKIHQCFLYKYIRPQELR